MNEILSLIEKYGVTIVLLVFFIFQYVKNNKDTLNLIIQIKDENNKLQNANVKAIYILKDDLKSEIDRKNNEVINIVTDKIGEYQEKTKNEIDKLTAKIDNTILVITMNKSKGE